MQGRAYPLEFGPAPPAVNDSRVVTVLEMQKHMPKDNTQIGAEAFLTNKAPF